METPLCRLADGLAGLSGWRRYGLAFLLGALLAGALPAPPLEGVLPFLNRLPLVLDSIKLVPPLFIFIAFPGLLWLDEGGNGAWASARLGYAFGCGFFVAGLYWIAAALFVDIGRYWWALPFAVLGVPAFMAFFPAAALGMTACLARRWTLAPVARLCLFAVAWAASEWLRGHVLTGFPWNLVGYVWAGGSPGSLAILQSTAWFGIYGLSFVTVLAAALPALLGTPSLAPMPRMRRAAPAIAAAALLLVPAAAGAIRLEALPTRLTETWVRLVQPSIPQTMKWDPAAASANFRRLLELSSAPAEHALTAVLWPEAAATSLLERDSGQRAAIAAVAPKDGYVITGALRANPPPAPPAQIWNSIEAIDGRGVIRAHYDKAHLVPFGEYMPFRRFLPIDDFIPGAIDMSPGPGARTLGLPGLPAFSPSVCYEAIFPGAVVDRAARPAWILNVTNDAWYGRSSGPYQHFAIARTRLDAIWYADVALPQAAEATPYSGVGDWIFGLMLLTGLAPVLASARRKRPVRSDHC